MDDAQIDPATLGYIEAHGTATPLGDPIEIEGLTLAFGNQPKNQYCAIGSLKSNMGHLTAAAGVAGFIKATLAVHHRQIPASLHFNTPNSAIDLMASPFFVNTKLTEWPSDQRRAGISSFGAGGTNIHIVIEGVTNVIPVNDVSRPLQLITWSAKSLSSREAYASLLADHLSQHKDQSLADVAFTLQTTRPALHHRRFAVAASAGELIEHLRNESTPANREMGGAHSLTERPDETVFMFPGQGAQYLNMGRGLYENEATYRQAIDECAALLSAHLDTDIREVLFPEQRSLVAEERLKNTRYTQPALFVTEYAMAKLWMSWGIEPTVFCGHSIGEFVAAHLAGVFTLADALKLIAVRGKLVSDLPRGSMLSVRMRADDVYSIMPEPLSLAAINSPRLCVVAGHDEDIAAFAQVLDDQNIPNHVLVTSHAFHSAMMDPILADFEKTVQSVTLSRPVKPIVSSVSGAWLTDAEALSPQYWATHLRVTVRFADALNFIMSQTSPLLLEVGPGSVTTTLARQQAGARPIPVLTSMANANDSRPDHVVLMKALGQLWLQGIEPDWQAIYANEQRVRLKLPTYAFDRQRYWVDPKTNNSLPSSADLVNEVLIQPISDPYQQPTPMRKETLLIKVREILENASGIEMETVSAEMSFLEIGLDSLLLTQVAQTLKKEFSLPLTFRQLNEDIKTLDRLAAYLDEHLPAEKITVITPSAPPAQAPVFTIPARTAGSTADAQPGTDTALSLIAQQLALLAKQVALLEGNRPVQVTAQPVATPVSQPAPPKNIAEPDISPEEAIELRKPFGATARIERHSLDLSPDQQLFLRQLTQRYNQKTRNSKAYTQQHRSHMADPRVVTGFKPVTKELVYPIVVNKSKGSRLWDIDGNEYLDTLNGFGSNMFGHQPDFIQEALHRQIDAGYEVGPQHELAGEVCKLIQEFTGFDRIALCNTGSEAVLGAMRIARTITGRSLIVAFSGSYHGIVDEVIVRGTKKRKTVPAAPGIMPEVVQNMLILDYGTEETLQIIKERASELAAVIVEPVQSRRPEFRPISFLQELRTVTAEAGTALVFDEVITGFRMHPGGAQALFGIKADLATYGKVVGGGMPIGVIAGKKGFMDALDGGHWQYGDASTPEVGVTYFAGTFVRHPLALAAAKASLIHLKKQGPALQQRLTSLTERLAMTINAEMTRRQIPLTVVQFGSLWKLKYTEEIPYGEILFTLLREKGIHIWDGFPCFVTEAYTDADIDCIIKLLSESIDELMQGGFMINRPGAAAGTLTDSFPMYAEPPVPGARLGRDKQGNPGWFIVNPDQPGNYLQVDL
ncbi:aminotransferase class III-fold pyridoxal phosphate-dependent enzyme [Spirosoma taeanense]|uniref:aminotransferase class III-fold pyridoxal phosphate-dependent enzyme n=1 Tax=Spirosoma taeanense TaxID=2735870 RepID=UPI00293BFBB1|nr:aminotransferase class III-fold pyridoxal phosphate-dependent enzyme [Spirosoma taeanense]